MSSVMQHHITAHSFIGSLRVLPRVWHPHHKEHYDSCYQHKHSTCIGVVAPFPRQTGAIYNSLHITASMLERETYVDRQTHTKTHRETDRHTERQTDTQRDRQTERGSDRQTDRQTERIRHRQTERERVSDRQRGSDRQTDRERVSDRQTDRQTEREDQTDRQTGRQREWITQTDRQKGSDRQTGVANRHCACWAPSIWMTRWCGCMQKKVLTTTNRTFTSTLQGQRHTTGVS